MEMKMDIYEINDYIPYPKLKKNLILYAKNAQIAISRKNRNPFSIIRQTM